MYGFVSTYFWGYRVSSQLQINFGLNFGSGMYFRVQAEFGLNLVGSFTILQQGDSLRVATTTFELNILRFVRQKKCQISH